MGKPSRWLVAAIIVLGALVLAVGGPTTDPPLSSQVAAYLTDRNLAMAVLLITLLLSVSARTLGVAVLITALMHALDAGFDIHFQNVPGAIGSAVFAILFLAVAGWLLTHPGRPLFRFGSGESGRSASSTER